MIKICFLVLTLSNGNPTLINANDIVAVTQMPVFGAGVTDIYFTDRTVSVTEKVEQIAEKLKECNPSRIGDIFIYVK